MRSVLLATLMLAFAAPVADAAVTVDMKVSPDETRYGEPTTITGTALLDGAPFAGQAVQLEARRYPFEADWAPIADGVTGADGTYRFEVELDRNTDLRVTTGGAVSPRERAYVFPAFTLSYRARSSRVVRLKAIARFDPFVVKRGHVTIRLKIPPLFRPTHVGMVVREILRRNGKRVRTGGEACTKLKTRKPVPFRCTGPSRGLIFKIADAGYLHKTKAKAKGRKRR